QAQNPLDFVLDINTYKRLIEKLPAITYVADLDPDSTTLYVSPQVETILGVPVSDYVADPKIWFKMIHVDDQQRVKEQLNRSHSSGSPFHCEYRMVGPDGRIVWFRDDASIVHDENGTPRYLQGMMIDITNQKTTEDLLNRSRELTDKIFENASIGIFIYRENGETIRANQAAADIVGTTIEEILEQNFRQLSSWKDSGLLKTAEHTLKTGDSGGVLVNASTTYGRNVWLDCRFELIESGADKHLLLLTNDVTSLKQTEEELRTHRDHLDQLVVERTSQLTALNDKLLREIELRKLAQQKQAIVQDNLEKSQENLRALLDAINESAFLMRLDGTVLALNETAANRIGYTSSQLLGKNLFDFIPKEVVETRRDKVRFVVSEKEAISFEDQRSGRTINQRVSPVFENDGSVKGVDVFAMDVTERRAFEKAIVESEELFRSTFEQAAVGIAHVSLEGRFLRINEKFFQILGYSLDSLIGVTFLKITHPDEKHSHVERIRELLAGDRANFSLEKRYIRHDGSAIWCELTVSLRRNADGSPRHFIAVIQDISWRKEMEEALQNNQQFMENIFSSIQDGLSIIDKDFNILRVNPAIEKSYAHAMPLQGKKCYEVYQGRKERCVVCPATKTIATGSAACDEVPFTGPGGTIDGWLELFSFPMNNQETGALSGVIEFARDISDRKRAEREALEYKEHLERINEELENFAYVASHDLREPLRKVAGFSELLEKRFRGNLDEKGDKYIFYILDGVQRMQQLIDDLLTYSRIGTDMTEADVIKTGELIQKVLLDLSASIDESNASIKVNEMPDIIGQSTRIRQLFQNIISNAIKFRRELNPEIEISCSMSGEEAIFSIRDNGIGISPDQFERIFGIFQRLHTREAYPGTGIGLAVCKKIVELHGGRIWVESVPGEGSIFRFTLKLAHPSGKNDDLVSEKGSK
ncbi:MAG: PAS domain S-box protein, partial [Syntrophaceae bacterium]|nr:PAS domain S-box protein [Syntrophaceae bacterium]